MISNTQKSKKLIRKIVEDHIELERLIIDFIENKTDHFNSFSLLKEKLETILGEKLTVNFLYSSDPHPNNANSIFDEFALDRDECLIDLGIFFLDRSDFSPLFKLFILYFTNLVGFISDRANLNIYVHQDKLEFFIEKLREHEQSIEKTENLPKIISAARISEYVQEEIIKTTERFEVNNNDENTYVSFQDRELTFNQLKKIRNTVRENFFQPRFNESNIETSDFDDDESQILNKEFTYISDLEVSPDNYFEESKKVYADIPLFNERNIGGRVAVTDTNLEFEKLAHHDRMKFRSPEAINFIKITEENNLFELALSHSVKIISIIIED